MDRFYHPSIPDPDGIFRLDPGESRHCLRVLRKRKGDKVEVTDGKGNLYTCVLMDENPTGCCLSVENGIRGGDTRSCRLHMAVSLLKNPSRFEWFLEKATETGIDIITPLICSRTEKQHFKPERFQNLLISAMKQSGRTHLPGLNNPVPFNALIQKESPGTKCIAWCGTDSKPLLKDMLRPGESAIILIGPEGDFTPDEIDEALAARYLPVSLGGARLRSETAALAACFTFNLLNLP